MIKNYEHILNFWETFKMNTKKDELIVSIIKCGTSMIYRQFAEASNKLQC